ncbi:MAG: sulfotransferase [Planctomycetota bacterium]
MGTPLIITGMHRSGTSLLANLLQEAGVAMGQVLEAASSFNPKGHFEDRDFMELHREALGGGDGELLYTATAEQELTLTEPLQQRAREYVQQRADLPLWGFKDPRTTLFLNDWRQLLPEARFVFVYRSPEFVVNSLRRRRDPPLFVRAANGNETFLWRRAADMWVSYNQRVLRFLAEHPQRCVLLCADSLATDFEPFLDAVRQSWQLPLHAIDTSDVFDPKLMRSHVPPVLRWKTRWRASVRQTLRQLEEAYRKYRCW